MHVFKKNEGVKKQNHANLILHIGLFVFGVVLTGNRGLVHAAAGAPDNAAPVPTWAVLLGYGSSHPGLGKTKIRVETIDLVLRHERILIDDVGSTWYQGQHSLYLEMPVHLVVDPDVGSMAGFNFLACWTFTAGDCFRPYLFAGGGPLYNTADIPGMGARLNGNYQFGGGFRYKLAGNRFLNIEYRFHHISNAGRKDPNDPLNSSKLLAGITF